MTTEVLLVRHGQTVWNTPGGPRARPEVPLDPVGMHQAEAVASRIADHWSPLFVYYSPLRRTPETATHIVTRTGASLSPHARFIAVDFGAREGRLPGNLLREGLVWI